MSSLSCIDKGVDLMENSLSIMFGGKVEREKIAI